MRFADIVGHDEIKDRLLHMADTDKIPHALLFGGASGIGKMQLARAFAQYIQCENRHDGDSCGQCRSCLQHEQLSNPDMWYIYPVIKKTGVSNPLSKDFFQEWKKFLEEEPNMRREKWLELIDAGNKQPVIYVSEAAEISRTAIMSNYASKYKIYLIWLPESMNIETANKLLKLIEEPWDNTIFLLVSNDTGKLLPTIFSRTQRLNLRPLKESEVAQYLMRKGFSERTAEEIASKSEGTLLRADELAMSKGEGAEFGNLYRQMMRATYGRRLGELYDLSDNIASQGRERISRFLEYCSHMTRENFIFNLRMPQLVSLSADEEEFSRRFSPYVNHLNVEPMTEELDRARRDVLRNANPRIVLYDLMLQIARYIRVGEH